MSLDSEKWTDNYKKIRPVFEGFTDKLRILVRELLEKEGIEYHLIEARTKSVQSFQEKATRPDKNYSNLKEITDLSGLRIAVYYLKDVESVAGLIEREFEIDWANSLDKGALLKPHEFGYRSLHYVVSLTESRRILPEWNAYKDLMAEIQIRTVLQHAWAAIDHALRYKKEADVPSQLRRRLFRLSGLLELADEEFSSLRDAQLSLRDEFRERLQKKDNQMEINIISLWEYIEISKKAASLTEIAKKNSAEIRQPKEYDLSELVAYCSASNISQISELDAFLNSVLDGVPDYFKQLMSSHKLVTNAPYLIIYLLIATHQNIFSPNHMKTKRWNKSFLEDIRRFGRDLAKHSP